MSDTGLVIIFTVGASGISGGVMNRIAKILIAFFLVIVTAGCIALGYFKYSENKYNADVYRQYIGYEERIHNALSSDDAQEGNVKEVLLKRYEELVTLQEEFAAMDQSFQLRNGELYRPGELEKEVEEALAATQEELKSVYRAELDALKGADNDDATSESLDEAVRKLNELSGELNSTQGKAPFYTQEEFDAILAEINEAIEAYNARSEELKSGFSWGGSQEGDFDQADETEQSGDYASSEADAY